MVTQRAHPPTLRAHFRRLVLVKFWTRQRRCPKGLAVVSSLSLSSRQVSCKPPSPDIRRQVDSCPTHWRPPPQLPCHNLTRWRECCPFPSAPWRRSEQRGAHGAAVSRKNTVVTTPPGRGNGAGSVLVEWSSDPTKYDASGAPRRSTPLRIRPNPAAPYPTPSASSRRDPRGPRFVQVPASLRLRETPSPEAPERPSPGVLALLPVLLAAESTGHATTVSFA